MIVKRNYEHMWNNTLGTVFKIIISVALAECRRFFHAQCGKIFYEAGRIPQNLTVSCHGGDYYFMQNHNPLQTL